MSLEAFTLTEELFTPLLGGIAPRQRPIPPPSAALIHADCHSQKSGSNPDPVSLASLQLTAKSHFPQCQKVLSSWKRV